MKKYSPGCATCCGGLAYSDQRDDEAIKLAPSPSPPPEFTATASKLDVTNIPTVGSDSVVVGVDIERDLLLIQTDTGEVWTISAAGAHPTLLWDSSSDAAGEVLISVKYHHSWGVAAAIGQPNSTHIPMMTFDADGDYVQGPFSAPKYMSFDQELYHCNSGGDLFSGCLNRALSGNVRAYFFKNDQINGTGVPNPPTAALSSGQFFHEVTTSNPGDVQQIYQGAMWHDDEDLYCLLAHRGAFTTGQTYKDQGIFLLPGGTDTQTLVLSRNDVFGPGITNTTEPSQQDRAVYDSLRNRINATHTATSPARRWWLFNLNLDFIVEYCGTDATNNYVLPIFQTPP